MKKLIDKYNNRWWFKYFDINKNNKIDWWECFTFLFRTIILILFFIGFINILLFTL